MTAIPEWSTSPSKAFRWGVGSDDPGDTAVVWFRLRREAHRFGMALKDKRFRVFRFYTG